MAHQDFYKYKELVGSDAFRLALLLPSSDISASIQAKLITTTLSNYDNSISDHYIALSYVWGDANNKRSILIDGKRLNITASLESAMRHIRDPKKELMIWADGICINQTDTEERITQVQIMGLIYQVARHTIIYLGEATPASSTLLKALNSVDFSIDMNRRPGLISNVSRIFVAEFNKAYPEDNAEENPKESGTLSRPIGLNKATYDSAKDMIKNWPWFTRVWVLQELVLSPDPWVQVGCDRIRWDIFSDRLLHQAWGRAGSGGLKNLSDMRDTRLTFGASVLRNHLLDSDIADRLLEVLHARRGLGVSDSRDMIYGHLGILGMNSNDDMLKKMIRIDYEQPTSELFKQVALYMISVRKGIDVFSYVEDIRLEDRAGFPSWVPDWTSPHPSPFAQQYYDRPYMINQADKIFISFDSSPVLGCMGTFAGVLEVVLDSNPPTMDLRALCHTLLGDTYSGSDVYEIANRVKNEVFSTMYGQLNDWFATQNVTPRQLGQREENEYYDATKCDNYATNLLEFSIWRCLRLESKTYAQSRDFFNANGFNAVSELLCSMTFMGDQGGLPGKKIALFENKDLVFVPMCAQAGDAIYRFSHCPVAYALRRTGAETVTDIEKVLMERFRELKEKHSNHGIGDDRLYTNTFINLSNLDVSSVGHFNFIGECLAELPNKSLEWYGRFKEEKNPQIIALH